MDASRSIRSCLDLRLSLNRTPNGDHRGGRLGRSSVHPGQFQWPGPRRLRAPAQREHDDGLRIGRVLDNTDHGPVGGLRLRTRWGGNASAPVSSRRRVAGHLGDTLETLQRTYAHWLRDDRDVPAEVLDRLFRDDGPEDVVDDVADDRP